MVEESCEAKQGTDISRDLRYGVEVELSQAEGRMEGSTVADSKGTWRTQWDLGFSQA